MLVERAHALLDTDPAAAEPFAAEAARLDPEHPSVKKVIALIAQAKRKQYVEQTVLQARELQNTDRGQRYRCSETRPLGLSSRSPLAEHPLQSAERRSTFFRCQRHWRRF